jgi:hypothetical protein
LNKVTIKNNYPFPRIDDLFDQLKNANIFSKIDLVLGYHQVRIKDEDIRNIAFRTMYGHYELTVVRFGLFTGEFIHQFLEVYLDDWTVYSLLKDHVEVLQLMLEICRQCQISLNIKKCIFKTLFGILLGHIV